MNWRHCDAPACDYKAKQNSHLIQHKASTHDIGVVWSFCDVTDCDFSTKQKHHLVQHKRRKHSEPVS